MAEVGSKKSGSADSPKIRTIYYDKNGEYIGYSDGSCEVKSSNKEIAGRWDDVNYVSPQQYRNLRASLDLPVEVEEKIKSMEGFLDEHPYHQSGGRVILLKYIEKDGQKISTFGKSGSVLNRKPAFRQPDAVTSEGPIDLVSLEEAASKGSSQK